MAQILSVTTLERKKVPLGEDLWLADGGCRGLRVRISNSVHRGRSSVFYYRYRDRNSGELICFRLGRYPGWTLDAIRECVKTELMPRADAGEDLRRYWKGRQRNNVEAQAQTIRAHIPKYLAYLERRNRSPATITTYRRYLRAVAHRWGDQDPGDISRGDVEDLFDWVKAHGVPAVDIDGEALERNESTRKGGPRAAGHLLSSGSAFWRWLVNRKLAPFNPWLAHDCLREESQSGVAGRVLSDDELVTVLRSDVLSARDSTTVRLLLATGLRPSEVCAAEWCEIDLRARVWEIPATRMKYKKAGHRVYLSQFSLDLLREWRRTQRGRPRFVFPSAGKTHRHITADKLGERMRRYGIGGFTPKVCRATVRTGLQRLGCPYEVRSRMSHHQKGDRVSRAYDQHHYDVEAKEWWQKWGAHLESLFSSRAPEARDAAGAAVEK